MQTRAPALQDETDGDFWAKVMRVTRHHDMVGRIQDHIIRPSTEQELLDAVCPIMVGTGGYRMAWIGYKGPEPECRVEPVAQAGHEEGYLEAQTVTWSDTERGRGPTGRAIRGGTTQLARDIQRDRRFKPWRAEARRRGYASSAAIPLHVDDEVIGALMVYSTRRDAFNDDEIALLERLAGNLAYGIGARRAEAARVAAEQREEAWSKALDHAAWGVAFSSSDGQRIERANQTMADLCGYTVDELAGRPVRGMYSKEEYPIAREGVETAQQAGHHRFETRLLRKDGSSFPVLLDISMVGEGHRRLVYIQDLRGQKAADEAHRQARRHEAELERLREADRLRARVMSEVAHELKNPLMPVLIQLRIIEEQLLDRPEEPLLRNVGIMRRSVDRIEAIIEDLRDASRLGDGRMALAPEPMDLAGLVCRHVDAYADVAHEHGLTMTVEAPDEAMVHADAHRIEQVLANLVGNARKYTPPGGRITVSVRPQDDDVRVEVQDDGVGVAADDRDKVFTPFGRSAAPARQGEVATGLGLFVSKGIIEQHGGHIGVESDGPGTGSTFWFTLRKPTG